MQTYHLFISHSWNYADKHDRLVELLTAHPSFSFKNFSVPPQNPIVGALNDMQLELAIENKIRPCSAVLIMAACIRRTASGSTRKSRLPNVLAR